MKPTVAVVLCTYNNPNVLRLSLYSITQQTLMPNEVIVADDGSTQETKRMVESFQDRLPIKHVWHEDKGFRRAMIMNRAFAACTSDYIVQIDGDIIMERHFVEDHVKEARRGYFLNGSRGKLTKELTDRIVKLPAFIPHLFTRGLTRKPNVIRLPWLTPLFYNYKKDGMVRGCNMSFWRDDLYAVNGYDNRMVGYGTEDIDLSARLKRLGVKKRFVKFKAIEYHIYHPEHATKHIDTKNHDIYDLHEAGNVVRTDYGLSDFLQPESAAREAEASEKQGKE